MACQVLVISRDHITRAGLAGALRASDASVAILGEGAGSASEAFKTFGRERPQVVLLEAGPVLAEDIRLIDQAWPKARVLIIARQFDPAALHRSLAAGALGFAVYGGEDLTRFMETMRQVGRGELAMCADSLEYLVATFPRQQPSSCEGVLTHRERDVLARLANGMSNDAIARDLYISVGTVKRHVGEILDKMEVRSRGEAVARFLGGSNHRAREEGPAAEPAANGGSRATEAPGPPRPSYAERHRSPSRRSHLREPNGSKA